MIPFPTINKIDTLCNIFCMHGLVPECLTFVFAVCQWLTLLLVVSDPFVLIPFR